MLQEKLSKRPIGALSSYQDVLNFMVALESYDYNYNMIKGTSRFRHGKCRNMLRKPLEKMPLYINHPTMSLIAHWRLSITD